MADKQRKVVLHYGGRKYVLPESQRDLLQKHDPSEPDRVRVNLGENKWLTIATGPGIPIALLETSDDGSGASMDSLG